jgi:hypothetical protein
MNVLKPDLQATVKTLMSKALSQREIHRKTGIDRKTIRRYGRLYDLLPKQEAMHHSKSPTVTGVATGLDQNPPPRPPGPEPKIPRHARSACQEHRDWIEQQVRLGRNAVAISCLSGCFSRLQYIVAQILRPYYGLIICGATTTSKPKKSLKGGHRLFSPIVPKDEFIQVNLEVMAADPVVCAKEPLL